jgi:hypothetical protein
MSLTDRTFPLCERSTSGGSLRVVVAGPDALSMASVRLPSMNTRRIAARHCGEQRHGERAGCGPCPCRRSTRRPSARAERHRLFTDAYGPFTDGEYCPFVGGGIDSG